MSRRRRACICKTYAAACAALSAFPAAATLARMRLLWGGYRASPEGTDAREYYHANPYASTYEPFHHQRARLIDSCRCSDGFLGVRCDRRATGTERTFRPSRLLKHGLIKADRFPPPSESVRAVQSGPLSLRHEPRETSETRLRIV